VEKSHFDDHFVIVGGGLAGISAVQALIKSGFGGKISLISKENTLPYDRTILSKNLMVQDHHIHIRDNKFLEDNGVNIMLGTTAKVVDKENNKIILENGEEIAYTKLLLATGT
jgi:NAD(P)H-nitrite reductase large subunit